MRSSRLLAALVATLGSGLLVAASPSAASAVQAAQPTVVNVKPASYTPDVQDGVVYALAQVGPTVFLGGSFTSIAPHGGSTYTTVQHIAAFTAGTGALQSGFAPTLDGTVNTIIPGPTAGTVYVGGDFKTVDGVTSRLALLDASTGAMAPGWTSPKVDGGIDKLVLADGQLFVGGRFDAIGGASRGGLATLNPTTGALTSYSTLSFTGHHNYGVNCTSSTCANAGVGIKSMDASPDGTRLIAIGNFTSVSGAHRDQVAMLDLGTTSATLDANWATASFSAPCSSGNFDSWIRDVQFSPDGSYFAIVGTGGGFGTKNVDGTLGLCDSVSRFETTGTGPDVQPTWVDWTGNDSFWSVAVTGAAIYAGGHERWLNNSNGSDRAGAGSVPRPGVAAVDPQNGMPIAWNPGRNPRGKGAYALLATPDGLYVGSDTDWIGNYAYHHDKIAFFPLAGGEKLPPNLTGSLPGNVYLAGQAANSHALDSVTWDGSSAPSTASPVGGFDASTVRGAFQVDGNLFYASTDGNFYERTFNGRSFGTATAIDPYDDPYWSNVKIGGNTTVTYRGVKSGFYGEMSSLTSLFYANGRVYYTLAGKSQMFWRYFETDDGVMGSQEFTTTDGNNWSHVAGAFLSGSTLYFADSTSRNLMAVPFTGGQVSGTPVLANSAIDWTSHGAFVLSASQIPPNQPPTAALTVSCTTTNTPCSADASGSNDADGQIVSYGWSWGDGSTSQTATATTSHTYATSGDYTVTVTVTDNNGATATASKGTHVSNPNAPAIAFRDAATFDGSGSTVSVQVPSDVQAGDALLLFETHASGTTPVSATAPSGWTQVGTTTRSSLTTTVYSRSATAADPGSTVTVALSASAKASLTLGAYANASANIEASASATDASTASHTSPTVSGLTTGSYAVTFWGDKSTGTTAWTIPGDVTRRAQAFGSGGGAVSAELTDANTAVSGSYGGKTATTNSTSGSGASWTIGLSQSG